MALYHFSLGHIKRTAGHTAIVAAAYRAGEKLYDAYYGETQDYSRKKGVVTTKIYAPNYVPERLRDRQKLWTEVEFNEHRKDAQLAYSLDIALQNELTMEENIELLDRLGTSKSDDVKSTADASVTENDDDSEDKDADVSVDTGNGASNDDDSEESEDSSDDDSSEDEYEEDFSDEESDEE